MTSRFSFVGGPMDGQCRNIARDPSDEYPSRYTVHYLVDDRHCEGYYFLVHCWSGYYYRWSESPEVSVVDRLRELLRQRVDVEFEARTAHKDREDYPAKQERLRAISAQVMAVQRELEQVREQRRDHVLDRLLNDLVGDALARKDYLSTRTAIVDHVGRSYTRKEPS